MTGLFTGDTIYQDEAAHALALKVKQVERGTFKSSLETALNKPFAAIMEDVTESEAERLLDLLTNYGERAPGPNL